MSIATTISETPAKVVAFAKQVGEIPEHVYHAGIFVCGVVMVMTGHKEIGTTVLTAALAMFRGTGKQ
jgi:hypothetical protein